MVSVTDERSTVWTFASPLAGNDWDQSTRSLPGWTVFHSQAWARVLVEAYGYTCTYLIGERAGQPVALVPIMEVDSLLTGRRGVGLPFTDECRPLVANLADGIQAKEEIKRRARVRKWKYAEVRGTAKNLGTEETSLGYNGHELSLRDLKPGWLSTCSQSHRRAVRKASGHGLRIEQSSTESVLREFYTLFCRTRKRLGAPPPPFRFFSSLQRHLMKPGNGSIVYARRNGAMVAAILLVWDFETGRATYRFGASDREADIAGASFLVMHAGIEYLHGRGFDCLEFGRTSLFNRGLNQFKLGWGARSYPVSYHRWSGETFEPETMNDRAGGLSAEVFRRLPIGLAKLAGRLLYRHIA